MLPGNVWKAVLEHSMMGLMLVFDKKNVETGPLNPSNKGTIKERTSSLTSCTPEEQSVSIEVLVGRSLAWRIGAQHGARQAQLDRLRHEDEETSNSNMPVDLRGVRNRQRAGNPRKTQHDKGTGKTESED